MKTYLCPAFAAAGLTLLLACLSAQPAHANEWDAAWAGDNHVVAVAPAQYLPIHNDAGAAPSAGGWLVSVGGQVVRLSGNGEVLARSAPDTMAYNGSGYQLRQLPDGSALLVAWHTYAPQVVRLSAQGAVVWRSALTSQAPLALRATDDSGAVWWFDEGTQLLYKLAPDGHRAFTRTLADLGLASVRTLSVSPAGDLALLAGPGGASGDQMTSVRLSRSGAVLSRWNGPNAPPSPGAPYFSAVLDSGHAILLTLNASSQTVVAHHDAQGVVTLPAGTVSLSGSDPVMWTTRTGFVLASGLGGPFETSTYLQFLSPAGDLQGTQTIGDTSPANLMPALDGALWAIGFNSFEPGIRLHRVTPSTLTSIALRELPRNFPFLAAPPSETEALIANDHTIYRANLSGQLTSLDSTESRNDIMFRAAGTTDSEGNSYVMQRLQFFDASSEGATLSKIARGGQALWSVPVSSHLRFQSAIWDQFNTVTISANSARVCYYEPATNFLYCHAASNGAFQARMELPAPGAFDVMELTADNRVLLRRHLGGAAPELALGADNLPISVNDSTFLAAQLTNARGEYLDFVNSSASVITAITRHSSGATPAVTWQLGISNAPAVLADGQPAVILLADGSVVLLGFDSNGHGQLALRKFNADGSLGFTLPLMVDGRRAGLRVVGDQVLVTAFTMPIFNSFFGGHDLFAYSLQDGHLQWRTTVLTPSEYGAALELDITPDGTHALWWTSDYIDLNARRIRLADGVEVARSDFPCGVMFCSLERLRKDAHGITLLPAMRRLEHDPFAAYVRADQELLEGAWYQPATSGQGVLFDYLPASRTWFGTWHTATDYRRNTLPNQGPRSGLRWFTLQGEASPDGAQAALGIYLASGGKFNQLPRISSTRIGDATLMFDSCTSGNLMYRFTSGEYQGSTGSIPLRLLTPHATACAAIGQAPATITPSERNGISNRYSGTWYNPETSGQGLEAAIRPELGNGSIIAGWFTFDPDAAADDALAQHWFTLQGDLSTAANGSVTLPVFRTIGGELDQTGTRNTARVGEATWSFQGCSQSQLSYRFDDSDVAGAFAGRIGTIPLQRIGDCAAP
jgi:hypothetical protein